MVQSIFHGLTRKHVLRAIADFDAGVAHPFASPTGYELLYKWKRYPPKAIAGLAHLYSAGRVLRPSEFSGGEAPGQANHVLRSLGFTVVPEGESPSPPESAAGRDWSRREVALTVADYFDLLRAELLGEPYSKTRHRQALASLLAGRSNGSIEFKHQNISAVLVDMGLPYVEGYKPRGNFQSLLADAVQEFLDQDPQFLERLADSPGVNPERAPHVAVADLQRLIETPPDRIIAPSESAKPWLSRKGVRINFARRDAANRRLAKLGEQFVVEVERHRLRSAGRDDLARRVEWVAQTCGDGLGFGVLSFDEAADAEKLIEVKTTGLGKFFPFYVTANEVRCSEDVPEQLHLYRVFDVSRHPRLYTLRGSLREACRLEPIQYRATL